LIPLNETTLIITDFDGTMTTTDVGFEVIKEFAGNGWHEIDRAYCEGKIGSKDAYTQIAALFRATREEMVAFVLEHGALDPYFREFYEFCASRGLTIKIVSDGLDFYIDELLKKYDLADIEYFANVVRFHDGGAVHIEFPESIDDCDLCGNCKSNILEQYRLTYETIIYIGNGYSDVCPAEKADLVFAKDILYEKCLKHGRDCVKYGNFRDITRYLKG
jgi:2-hydroxy-3-keto-5-methylthiopentenyl-1-phosphate phosphatase